MSIEFTIDDPFNEEINNNDQKIHLRCQMRNGKKSITIVEDLPEDLDLKKIVKYIKKKFQCNGSIKNVDEKNIIQFSGDQRENIFNFFVENKIADAENIIVHGK
jgi:translation initiation factor 1